jgi:GSH-dependent disulfide-bond oxidoreductase
MQPPIELFFWTTPNCWKITVALEEMALPYVLKPINIGAGEQFSADFLAISPNNRVPAIIDPQGSEGARVTLFESGAILTYLARKSGMFYPANGPERASVEQWLFWQVSGLGPMFGQASHFNFYAPALVNDQADIAYGTVRYNNEVNRLLGVLNRALTNAPYLAGEYSIADMAAYPWAAFAGKLGQDLAAFPHVADWLSRIGARPAVQRGMAAGGDLQRPAPERGSEEQRRFAASLFGQTAQSVTEAARRVSGQ